MAALFVGSFYDMRFVQDKSVCVRMRRHFKERGRDFEDEAGQLLGASRM